MSDTTTQEPPAPANGGGTPPDWLKSVAEAMLADRIGEDGAGAPSSPTATPDGRRIFSPSDLRGDELCRFEEYEMPDGSIVYVGPCSGRDAQTVALWSAHVPPEMQAQEGDTPEVIAMKRYALIVDGWALTVIAACYREPRRDPRLRVFAVSDKAALMANLSAEVLREIAEISATLGKRQTVQREEMQRFFGLVQTFTETFCSQPSISDDSLPGFKEQAKEIGLLAMRLNLLKSTSSGGSPTGTAASR